VGVTRFATAGPAQVTVCSTARGTAAATSSERFEPLRSVSGGTTIESESPRAAMSRAAGVRNVEIKL
jgi:hypothetical protein